MQKGLTSYDKQIALGKQFSSEMVVNSDSRSLKSKACCYDSLLGNRLVNLGISKQKHLYLKTKNLI